MFPVTQFPRALCRRVDPDTMFPNLKDAEGIAEARETCVFCPHRAECLEAALSLTPARDAGVRAGTTKEERRKIRRNRAAAARKEQQAIAA
ncbi:WhiB family transcriptional regulator [Streptomyces sp. MJM8645]|uniref:WhiB family transcriptional regulator n=1 Tax=Streptomycetaceae TaxID=2062 RepID=UPI0007AFBFF4|nr:WhiB family transcriptional regulator [Streptomyces sp. MJM8645]